MRGMPDFSCDTCIILSLRPWRKADRLNQTMRPDDMILSLSIFHALGMLSMSLTLGE
jgi:hypothetical protein